FAQARVDVTIDTTSLPIGKIGLRGDPTPEFLSAVESAIGVSPPVEPGFVAVSGSHKVLWLGPTEWLVGMPLDEHSDTTVTLDTKLRGQHVAIVDLSDAMTLLTISGPDARLLLAKGCGLDLHPRVFGRDRCARSSLAKLGVLIHQTDELPSYDLYVDRGYADYAVRWLEQAAVSFFAIAN
ncbi:MAG: sarcosine oxidase subunit gamma family protein, partial [Pseudomonadales bacterium]